MVTFDELRALDPQVWLDAGSEWLALADAALGQADTLRATVADPLRTVWPDAVGRYALDRVATEADLLLIASLECRAASCVCRGLGRVLESAQRIVADVVRRAADESLRVDDAGRITDSAGRWGAEQSPDRQDRTVEFQRRLDDALLTATWADERASRQLDQVARRTGVTDVRVADSDDLGAASRVEADLAAAADRFPPV